MKYTHAQAEKLAKQIREKFHTRIVEAIKGTPVSESWLAGLIAVESNGRENATRFEPHVYTSLKAVKSGSKKSYNNITRTHLADADDGALRNLATSWGATQVMGWWSIHLGITVGQLRDPGKHLKYAVRLLLMNSGRYVDVGDYESALRIWNTGSPKKKTHDPSYVFNATAVSASYSLITPTETAEVDRSEAQPEATIAAVPPLPSHVPGWAKKVVGWGAGINIAGLGGAFAFFRDNPEALSAALTLLKWTLIGLGGIGGVVVIGVFAAKLYYAKLANDLNKERLRNFADPGTRDVDFAGWKDQATSIRT